MKIEQRKNAKGQGRKTLDPSGNKKQFKTTTICGSNEEIEQLKQLADKENKSLSRFIIDKLLNS